MGFLCVKPSDFLTVHSFIRIYVDDVMKLLKGCLVDGKTWYEGRHDEDGRVVNYGIMQILNQNWWNFDEKNTKKRILRGRTLKKLNLTGKNLKTKDFNRKICRNEPKYQNCHNFNDRRIAESNLE